MAEEGEAFWRLTVAPKCHVVGAYHESILVGVVAYRKGWIDHLHVAPGLGRAGIGSLLLNAASDGQAEVQLWTFRENQGACRFYERHGFRVIEETGGGGNEYGAADRRYAWFRR